MKSETAGVILGFGIVYFVFDLYRLFFNPTFIEKPVDGTTFIIDGVMILGAFCFEISARMKNNQ